jgi:hypothetical protein
MKQPASNDGALLYKPDWPKAKERWVAFWDRSSTDRPCMDIRAPARTDVPPVPSPKSLEDLYFDPEYISKTWLRMLESTWFGGEAVPTGGFFMGGYALGCGSRVRFAPYTVWHPVTMSSIDGPLNWHPGPEDPWQQKLDRVIHRLLDLSPGKFLVGYACQVMVNDLLMLLRGTDAFMVDLVENMPKCVQRLKEGLALWFETFEHYRTLVNSRQNAGSVFGWPGLWHPTTVKGSQSDMSCMISTKMFQGYVMVELNAAAERYGPLWYHLDGPGALHHVPALLSSPSIRVIQWVPGSGQPDNGPAWIDLYRQVQAAGRGLDLSVPRQHAEFLIRHLRPEGFILRTGAKSREDGEELLENAVKWCGSHANSSV